MPQWIDVSTINIIPRLKRNVSGKTLQHFIMTVFFLRRKLPAAYKLKVSNLVFPCIRTR